MGMSLLSHVGCGGSVVVDLSNSVKLVAPAFQLAEKSVSGLMIDTQVTTKNGRITPQWACLQCGKVIPPEKYETEIESVCIVCSRTKPLGELVRHRHLNCVCRKCVNEMISLNKGKVTASELPRRLVEFASAVIGDRPSITALVDIIRADIDF